MKKWKKSHKPVDTLVSIICDCCKKEYTDQLELQEFLCYANDAGYGSIMGDGNQLRLDLCQYCTQDILGSYIRIEGNYIWDPAGSNKMKLHLDNTDPPEDTQMDSNDDQYD